MELDILISEDNLHKFNNILKAIRNNFKDMKITIINESYAKKTVLEFIKWKDEHPYDILIQDMQLPMHSDDYHIDPNGGLYVLNQLIRKNCLPYTIICSSSNDTKQKLLDDKFENVKFIKYDSICIDWEKDLIKYIHEYLETKGK